MGLATLALERRGAVLVVRVRNPPTDLLDAGVIADLGTLVPTLHRAPDIRAVVLTGPRRGVFVPHYLIDDILAGSERLGVATPYPVALMGVAAAALAARVGPLRRLVSVTPAGGLVELAETHRMLTGLGRIPQVGAEVGPLPRGGGVRVRRVGCGRT